MRSTDLSGYGKGRPKVVPGRKALAPRSRQAEIIHDLENDLCTMLLRIETLEACANCAEGLQQRTRALEEAVYDMSRRLQKLNGLIAEERSAASFA